jgi:NAD(P)-dependent dehydrogenase (short-subunit alcohol dehydrogenase family)
MATARKRVLVVGASGIIGRAVADLLGEHNDVVKISKTSGDCRDDATSIASIEVMLSEIGSFDSLVAVIGSATMGSIYRLSSDDFLNAFRLKVLSQVDLMRIGLKTIWPGGRSLYGAECSTRSRCEAIQLSACQMERLTASAKSSPHFADRRRALLDREKYCPFA